MFRQHGAPVCKTVAIGTAEIRWLVPTFDRSLSGKRDRTVLLMGFAGALRCSELVGICREHVTFTHEGVRLVTHRLKAVRKAEISKLVFRAVASRRRAQCGRWRTGCATLAASMVQCSERRTSGVASSVGDACEQRWDYPAPESSKSWLDDPKARAAVIAWVARGLRHRSF